MAYLMANEALTTIVGMAVAGVLGFLVAQLKRLTKLDKARIEIDKCTARRDIFDAYEDYIVRGKHMTISRYDELEREFEAYLVLGGNGTAKKYMEEIRAKKKPYLVVD